MYFLKNFDRAPYRRLYIFGSKNLWTFSEMFEFGYRHDFCDGNMSTLIGHAELLPILSL